MVYENCIPNDKNLLDFIVAQIHPTPGLTLIQLFANQFELRYVSQGYYENRAIETTLDLGWELLSMFENSELKRMDLELVEKYMPKFRKESKAEEAE